MNTSESYLIILHNQLFLAQLSQVERIFTSSRKMTKFEHRAIAGCVWTLFIAFVILYLKPPLMYERILWKIIWASLPIYVIASLPYAVTEWVKTRYRYIVASTRHRLYGPDTPASAFLLLPPEIRLQIWEELTPRCIDPCAHTRISVEVEGVELMDTSGIGDVARYVFGFKRRSQIFLYPTMPLALLRTCRQNYEEGCHDFYGTRTFSFHSPRALYQFVNALSLSQQGHIQHLELDTHSSWCIKPQYHRDSDWHRHTDLYASQVPSAMEKLQNLRTLNIGTMFPINAENVRYYARFIYHLLRHVKASETVTVNMNFCVSNRCSREMRWGWGSQGQKQFAITAWRIIRDPTIQIKSVVARPGQFMRSKYVLVAQIPV